MTKNQDGGEARNLPVHNPLLVVAGWSLKSVQPRVWDSSSPFYLPTLGAMMVSYAEFHSMKTRRRKAMEQGLHEYLGVPRHIKIYLDNGAFSFIKKTGSVPEADYIEFVNEARPDWYPVPQDFIPTPTMSPGKQKKCFTMTMEVNRSYQENGFVPIVHISNHLGSYLARLSQDDIQVLKAK